MLKSIIYLGSVWITFRTEFMDDTGTLKANNFVDIFKCQKILKKYVASLLQISREISLSLI